MLNGLTIRSLTTALLTLCAGPALAMGDEPPPPPGASFRLIKTVAGQPPTINQSFRFEVRDANGQLLAFNYADHSNAGHVDLAKGLAVPGVYQICEVGLPAGWTTTNWSQAHAVPWRPANEPNTECRTLELDDPNNLSLFVFIDNIPGSPPPPPPPAPSGPVHTIGYWKNWSSCSSGGQAPVLDETLSSFPGGSVQMGSLQVDTCLEAVSILNKSTLGGAKRASDPAYRMAAQLLGAKLNVQNYAYVCTAAATAISQGEALLTSVSFNGNNDYRRTIDGDTADTVAEALDGYNNGILCK